MCYFIFSLKLNSRRAYSENCGVRCAVCSSVELSLSSALWIWYTHTTKHKHTPAIIIPLCLLYLCWAMFIRSRRVAKTKSNPERAQTFSRIEKLRIPWYLTERKHVTMQMRYTNNSLVFGHFIRFEIRTHEHKHMQMPMWYELMSNKQHTSLVHEKTVCTQALNCYTAPHHTTVLIAEQYSVSCV